MNVLELKQVGPYMGVQRDEIVKHHGRTFRLMLYGAYNAFGLIGSECNGIVVLDEDNMCVVLDEEAKISSGYFGASDKQKARFDELVGMSWEHFEAWIDGHRRRRE